MPLGEQEISHFLGCLVLEKGLMRFHHWGSMKNVTDRAISIMVATFGTTPLPVAPEGASTMDEFGEVLNAPDQNHKATCTDEVDSNVPLNVVHDGISFDKAPVF